MQKIVIIALLCASAFAATMVNVGTGEAAGFVVSMGVIQKCHRSCLTCVGPLATHCDTCAAGTTASNGLTKQSDGTCGCAALSHVGYAATAAICELDSVSPWTGIAADCVKVLGMYADVVTANKNFCKFCDDECVECTAATSAKCTVAKKCWADVTATGTPAVTCTYAEATSYVTGLATIYSQVGEALSIVNGYFYTAGAVWTQTACNVGCLTCDLAASPAVLCSTCAAGFMAVGTAKVACECAAGNFATPAGAATLGACSPCQAGCLTCSSVTICTVCDSSNQLGATTDSSSTCETSTGTTDAVTVTTTGTSTAATSMDGESSNKTTDATTTNGVLITAATMLLAVILA